ncbi:hypothetical protein A0J61_10415 [Choanephora cucurbitarum]|uniref:Uncharacterized protein n=1 Tax=Choanephora cucurbitarum TaxID=101091 RepID=A0A1C7MXM9_9FUNG|nr:hypothetical protein A0J61_10415 [Choanephora cucurbitarum]
METYALEKELKQFISAEKIARLHIFLVRFKVQIFKEPSSSVRNFKSVWIRRFKTSYKEIKDVELNEKSPLLPDGQFFQAFFDEMPKADECTATKSMTKKVLYINHQNAHDNDLEWFVGGEDLSSTLMKYRNNAIEIALNNEAMTDKHLMLLNYIFFFDKANTTINELGMLDKLVDIKRQLNRSYGYSAIDHNLSMLCYRLVQVCVGYDQDEDIEEVLLEERLKAKKEKDQDKTLLLSLFEVYYEKMKRINFTTEQSYVDYVLSPLFEHFFDSIHGTEHHRTFGESP